MSEWHKGEVIALFGVIVAVLGVVAPVIKPELRYFLVKDCSAREATLNAWNEMQSIDKDSVRRNSDIDS